MMNRKNLISLGVLISITINLFFIGGIGYRLINTPEFDIPSVRPLPPNLGWVVRDLSEERRSELEPQLLNSYERVRAIREEMFTAQRNVNELMTSSLFDGESLNQAFKALRATSDRYQALSHKQTISLLEQLNEEERTMAMKFVQRRGPRARREGRGDFGVPPDLGGPPRRRAR